MNKCAWANSSELLKRYHDEEWGKPIHDDQKLFEILILESMSCGLSWEIVLKKRNRMIEVFDNKPLAKVERFVVFMKDKVLRFHQKQLPKSQIINSCNDIKSKM